MFEKTQIEALFGELDREWRGKSDFEKISREVHLASPTGTPVVH